MSICFVCYGSNKKEKLINYNKKFLKLYYHNSCVENVIANPINYDNNKLELCIEICNDPTRLRLLKECKRLNKEINNDRS